MKSGNSNKIVMSFKSFQIGLAGFRLVRLSLNIKSPNRANFLLITTSPCPCPMIGLHHGRLHVLHDPRVHRRVLHVLRDHPYHHGLLGHHDLRLDLHPGRIHL